MNGQRPPGNAQQASYAQAASRGLSGGRGRGLLGLVHWGLEPPVPSVIQKPREEAPVNVPPVVKEPQVQAKQQAKKSNDIYVAKDSSMPAKQQTKKNQDACGKGPVLQLQHWGLEPPVPSVIQKPREEAPVNVTPVVKEPQVQAKQQAKKSNNIYVAKDSSMPAKQQTKKNQDTCGKDPVSGLNEYCQKNHKLMASVSL